MYGILTGFDAGALGDFWVFQSFLEISELNDTWERWDSIDRVVRGHSEYLDVCCFLGWVGLPEIHNHKNEIQKRVDIGGGQVSGCFGLNFNRRLFRMVPNF